VFNIKKFFRSFVYAFRGLRYALGREQNFQVHFVAAGLLGLLMWYFHLRTLEVVALVLCVIIVLVLELINTVFEKMVDLLKPRIHPYAEVIKDMMAATVLVASIGALVIGVIIFFPYISQFVAK